MISRARVRFFGAGLAAVAGMAIVGNAALADGPSLVARVNQRVAELLAPLNDTATEARLAFKSLEFDEVKPLAFGFDALFKKTGPSNELRIEVKDFSYAHGVRPRVALDLGVAYDFSGYQREINAAAEDAPGLIDYIVSTYGRKYGNAIEIDAAIDSLKRDAQGNVTELAMHLNGDLDPAKLPGTTPVEKVEFFAFRSRFVWTKSRLEAQGYVDINPLDQDFVRTQNGLKSYVEKLLAGDRQVYEQIQFAFGWLNGMAERGVGLRR